MFKYKQLRKSVAVDVTEAQDVDLPSRIVDHRRVKPDSSWRRRCAPASNAEPAPAVTRLVALSANPASRRAKPPAIHIGFVAVTLVFPKGIGGVFDYLVRKQEPDREGDYGPDAGSWRKEEGQA